MAWTTPKTWVSSEALTASDLNTHVRDNLNALKAPPTAHYEANESSNYTSTSTSFVDVDSVKLALTITTTGGDVLVGFSGACFNASANIMWDVVVDSTRAGGDDGFFNCGANAVANASFVRLITGLGAGSHTFKLQWRTSAGTSTLYAGAGTSNLDTHPQFWVREVS